MSMKTKSTSSFLSIRFVIFFLVRLTNIKPKNHAKYVDFGWHLPNLGYEHEDFSLLKKKKAVCFYYFSWRWCMIFNIFNIESGTNLN